MKQEKICITCPIGCHLTLEKNEGEELQVSGNRCPRGRDYAFEEFYSPKRTVTTTVKVASQVQGRLPVRTTAPLLLKEINPLLNELYRLELKAPVKKGELIVSNFHDTGVDVVASLSLPA